MNETTKKKKKKKKKNLGLGLLAGVVIAAIGWWRLEPSALESLHERAPASPPPSSQERAHEAGQLATTMTSSRERSREGSPTNAASLEAVGVGVGVGVEPLRTAFASDDDAKKIAAVEDVVRDGVLPALPMLAAIELPHEPEAAPTVIHAIANLSVQGDRADRVLGVRTLSRWLRDEGEREHDARDAAGNVPNLVEALGEIGGREAVDTLTAALDAGTLDLSVQTLTVQKLAEIGDPRASTSITRFSERVANNVASIPPDDDFERQLHTEALAEAKSAIARLSRPTPR